MKKEYKAPELEVIKLHEEIMTDEVVESIMDPDEFEGNDGSGIQ